MITRADLLTLRNEIHRNAVDHGWWEGGVQKRSFREILLLIVGEVSELHEAFRHNKLMEQCDKHIGLTCLEEETADIVIRLLDAMGAYGIAVDNDVYPYPIHSDASLGEMLFEIVNTIVRMETHRQEYLDKLSEQLIGQCMTLMRRSNLDLLNAVRVKHEYNKGRPYRHGGLKA